VEVQGCWGGMVMCMGCVEFCLGFDYVFGVFGRFVEVPI
jgi:hypothetical protein